MKYLLKCFVFGKIAILTMIVFLYKFYFHNFKFTKIVFQITITSKTNASIKHAVRHSYPAT